MKINIVRAGSSILFHATTLDSAVNILESKHFLLRPAVTSDETKFGTALYFLSTARSVLSEYFNNLFIYAVFQLDGTRIGQNHKVIPVEFFEPNDWSKVDEKEDRVLSTKNTLSTKYVTAIHIPTGNLPKYRTNVPLWTLVQQIKRLAKKLGIPVYFYKQGKLTSLHSKNRVQVPFENIPVDPVPLPGINTRVRLNYADMSAMAEHKMLARLVLFSVPQLRKTKYKLSDWYVSHKTLYSLVISVVNNIHNPYHMPILAKTRKNKWSTDHLVAYIRAKLMYMLDNTLLTDIVYTSLTQTLDGSQKTLLAGSSLLQLEAEHLLIKEENLDYRTQLKALETVDVPTHLRKYKYLHS